jgi:dipeptidyl aminopeptidase/acylaminoacyl peptidase
MHDDVMDATRALFAEGKVDPNRVCIVGGSYGGYEALYAAAVEPSTFKCAVSLDGVSDLVGIVKFERTVGTDSPTWAYWRKSEGDPARDSAVLLAHSPYRLAATWTTPTLLIHGEDDQVVPVEESRQMNRALLAAGKPVRYVEVAGMGHGPSSDDEIQKVYSEIDLFLATHLSDKPAATGAATH